MKIGNDTRFELRIAELAVILVIAASGIGMYFSLLREIEHAKELPSATVTKEYIDNQHTVLKLTLDETKTDLCDVKDNLSEIKEIIQTLDSRIYDIHRAQTHNFTAYEGH